uniref:Uncharacterized protein n=1 Tax=Aegilops tauschii TaxID=37682 RepID=M8BYW8_AEGTA
MVATKTEGATNWIEDGHVAQHLSLDLKRSNAQSESGGTVPPAVRIQTKVQGRCRASRTKRRRRSQCDGRARGYHVLLEYLSPSDLARVPASGRLVTALFQTTSRAASDLGVVNLTAAGSAIVVRSPALSAPGSNATDLGAVTREPYNTSVLAVGCLIVPSGFDTTASGSESFPRGQHHRRARVQRGRLHARGLWRGGRLRGRRAGRRHHHLRPHRRRVRGPPRHRPPPVPPLRLQGRGAALLPPARVPQSIVNPVQPTLATECNEAGRFMLNITRFNGSVAIDTGVVQASHTCTVFDQNPVAIFAVSKVLLPKEMFGRGNTASPRAAAPPATMTPDLSDGLRTPPTKLSSPPALRGQDN